MEDGTPTDEAPEEREEPLAREDSFRPIPEDSLRGQSLVVSNLVFLQKHASQFADTLDGGFGFLTGGTEKGGPFEFVDGSEVPTLVVGHSRMRAQALRTSARL